MTLTFAVKDLEAHVGGIRPLFVSSQLLLDGMGAYLHDWKATLQPADGWGPRVEVRPVPSKHDYRH